MVQPVGWAKRSVLTIHAPPVKMGTLRFAHPTIVREFAK
jgi:hypothetical protein